MDRTVEMDSEALEAKYRGLQEILRSMESVCVAFSGGVDSTFLLAVAVETLGPDKVLAVTGVSPALPARERSEAAELARRLGCRFVEIATTELDDARYSANPPERCYYCKADLYAHLRGLAEQHGLKTMVNGANSDDTGDFRPGMQAADRFAVRSPLLEAGLGKDEIRLLSAERGLATADKPAMACLASRFPYGTAITAEGLAMVEAAEEYLWGLGLRNFRVRHHGTLARIELPADRIAEFAAPQRRAELVGRFKEIGYVYVALDLQGFRSGSGNEALRNINRPVGGQAGDRSVPAGEGRTSKVE